MSRSGRLPAGPAKCRSRLTADSAAALRVGREHRREPRVVVIRLSLRVSAAGWHTHARAHVVAEHTLDDERPWIVALGRGAKRRLTEH